MVGFWYSAVHVKSEQSHRVKASLGSRDQLVRAKRALGNQVRGVLRPVGTPMRAIVREMFFLKSIQMVEGSVCIGLRASCRVCARAAKWRA